MPGGGKRPGEDMENALKRECYEECGCNIEIVSGIGEIVEYRDMISQKHETHGFIVRVVGAKKEPVFTEYERNSEYKLSWVDLDEAIKLVADSKPLGKFDLEDFDGVYFARFIVKRELIYLEKAKELLDARK